MNRKNVTRNALFTSIISLLLCVSMLVGTTFAWFTDEVVTGMNTIAAGNLDIELMANGTKVGSTTKLFDDVELWEPGVVVYENLQVANVGTLALKYQMSLNFGNENDLNGHKLSEVLKIAVVDKIAAGADRQAVLAAAKASENVGTLANFYVTGSLKAGEVATEQAIVIFWEPNANEIDNLYNANNGQTTSDGEALHIEFGVNLQATQLMYEEDSFGPDYDEFAAILPKAKVFDLGAKTINATLNAWGSNAVVNAYDAPFVMQFQPNESLEECLSSAYKYYNVDYVVSADRDVPANSMALLGYYTVFCDAANNNNWVALSADETIEAGTKIRLVETMGQGAFKVSYKDICQWGNDGTGFLCSAVDLTGANAGTTLTVELRVYKTTSDPNSSSNEGDEVDPEESYVIGTYTYTFGGSYINVEDGSILFNEYEGDISLIDVRNVASSSYSVPQNADALANGVFAQNSNITTVTIPASVNDFGASGVSDTNASGGAFKGSSVTSVVLEEGMTEIPAAAFNGAMNLTSVNIPSTVTTIGVNAFRSTAIKELTIPATVTNISYGAFRDMASLEKVVFEGTHVDIPNYAFRGCSNLRVVDLRNVDTATIGTNMAFCNASSNNPNTNNITFYCKNAEVAELVKASMGVGSYVAIYVGDTLYAEIGTNPNA